eukprot:6673786-Alexandrium_andersonii.AAC.1
MSLNNDPEVTRGTSEGGTHGEPNSESLRRLEAPEDGSEGATVLKSDSERTLKASLRSRGSE